MTNKDKDPHRLRWTDSFAFQIAMVPVGMAVAGLTFLVVVGGGLWLLSLLIG